MKLKMFGDNEAVSSLQLTLMHGAYDAEAGRVVFIVSNGNASGVLTLEVSEARALCVKLPTVEKVTI